MAMSPQLASSTVRRNNVKAKAKGFLVSEKNLMIREQCSDDISRESFPWRADFQAESSASMVANVTDRWA
jgi:hypothetical protein